jgi:hypothetical protein
VPSRKQKAAAPECMGNFNLSCEKQGEIQIQTIKDRILCVDLESHYFREALTMESS